MSQIGHVSESVVIRSYVEKSEKSEYDDNQSIEFLRAEEYNRVIETAQSRTPFFYRGTSEETDAYRALLPGTGGVMCIVDIPSIGICLPVGHGTSDEVLDVMAGHVCGTSLPIGGISTNCVIAAHSGSTSARLFTDLGKITPGDKILVHVLSRTLTYRVLSDQDISVVLPYDGKTEHADSVDYDAPYFRIKPGEDILTLYTCTPVGINSHRLIVSAHRVETDQDVYASSELHSSGRHAKSLVACILLAPVPILGAVLMFRKVR
jgi:sortase A